MPGNLGAAREAAVGESFERGALGAAMADVDDVARAKVRERVRTALRPFVAADGVAPPGSIWLVSARA